MAKYDYPPFVLKSLIQCEEDVTENYRYSLTIPFSRIPKNKVFVILKNPSVAAAKDSDHTANRVANYCFRKGFDQVTLMNLFAYRTPNADDLVELCKNKGGEQRIKGIRNDEFIRQAAGEASKIIVAWGTAPKGFERIYIRRIKDVLRLLNPLPITYVDRVSEKGPYPLHGQVWGYEMEMKDWKLA